MSQAHAFRPVDLNATSKRLSALRNPSSDLKPKLLLQKRGQSSFKSGLPADLLRPVSKIGPELTRDTHTETLWKKRLDDVRSRVLQRRAYLIDLQDKLEEYSKTNTLIVDEEASNKRIKILENKVDNLMIKFNEAMNIKRMYEGLILTLKQQRTTYDKKIVAMERLAGEKEVEVQAAAEVYQKAVLKKQGVSQKYKDYECRRDEVQAQREKYLVSRKAIETELEAMQRKELRKLRTIEDPNGIEGVGGGNGAGAKVKQMSMAVRPGEVPAEDSNESVDYNFLEEFFQRVFEITGAKDGGVKSERNHPEIHQSGRKTGHFGGAKRGEFPEVGRTRRGQAGTAGGHKETADAAGGGRAGDRDGGGQGNRQAAGQAAAGHGQARAPVGAAGRRPDRNRAL